MKKFLKLTVIAAVITASLAVLAFAADFTHCADALSELGLFKGTQNGYELDRAPNRAEAATMLVRLLGAEEEAMKLTYTAPFNDVADWAKPYVQYLYDNGLTKGTSATTFGYSDKCTAQQYATFLLRSLGYSDGEGGDFSYIEAMGFAEEKGVVDPYNCNEEAFLRDHIAAMSYTALSVAPKSGEADLLSKLVASGAIKDAKGFDEMFKVYRAYCEDEAPTPERCSMTIVQGHEYSIDGTAFEQAASVIELAFDSAAETPEIAYTLNSLKTSYVEETALMVHEENYYRDGYLYINNGTDKYRLAMTYEDAISEIGLTDSADTIYISLMKSISVEDGEDGAIIYKIEYVPELILGEFVAPDGNEVKTYSMEISSTHKDGEYISSESKMIIEVDMGENGVYKAESIAVISNIIEGDDVVITVPEKLDEYITATLE